MLKNKFLILLISLLTYHGFCFAKITEPTDYYLNQRSEFLKQLEKEHLQPGKELVKKGKFDFAWREFATILHYIPNHPEALNQIGILGLEIEKPEQARKYFERALQHYQHAQTHVLMSQFLGKQQAFQAAIQHLEIAMALDPKHAAYYHQLSLVYLSELPSQANKR